MPLAVDLLLAEAHGAVLAVVDLLAVWQSRDARRHGAVVVVEEVPLAVDLLLVMN